MNVSLFCITEDGFEIAKTIEPGQTKYYTKNINVGRKPGNEQPLENVIKKVTGHYNVGKHKVTEVAQAP